MKAMGAALLLAGALTGCGPAPVPAPQGGEARRILDDDRYEWITIAADGARIHLVPGSYADSRQQELQGRVAAARTRVLRRLGIESYPRTLDLFYVDGRPDMEQLTGSPVTGFAYHEDDAVVLVFNAEWRGFERHELAHVVTLRTWGEPAGDAVLEGIATFADGECGGYENGRIARTMADLGILIGLPGLVSGFRAQDDLIAYIEAAALVEFARERAGPAVLRRLWSEGLRALPDLLDIPSEEFAPSFRSWLTARFEPVPEPDWLAIRAEGCGVGPERAAQ